MTHDEVQDWLDRYIAAWETYDPAAIGDMFSESATYRFYPYAEAVVGRAEIVRAWTQPGDGESDRDEPGTWAASYAPFAVDGDRAVAVGESRYFATSDEPERLYHNCYLLEFDDSGRCRSFVEYYVEQKRA